MLLLNQKRKKYTILLKIFNGYMAYLCDLISNDLDKIWYTDDKFKENRENTEILYLIKVFFLLKLKLLN